MREPRRRPEGDDAVETFERYDHGLSFTDATTVALCERHDVDAVLSFDDDFDGIVERVAPAGVVEQGETTE